MSIQFNVNAISAGNMSDWNSRRGGLNFPGLDMEMLICLRAQAPIVSFWEVQPI